MMVTFWASAEARMQAETNGALKTALTDIKPYLGSPLTVHYYKVDGPPTKH